MLVLLCDYDHEIDHECLLEIRKDLPTQELLCGNPNGSDGTVDDWVKRRLAHGWFKTIRVNSTLKSSCRGFVQLSGFNRRSRYAWVGIGLHCSYRGIGLGFLVMQELHAEAVKLKLRKLLLEVRTDNAAAISLYLKLGYRRVGELHEHYWNGTVYFDVLIMERSLI